MMSDETATVLFRISDSLQRLGEKMRQLVALYCFSLVLMACLFFGRVSSTLAGQQSRDVAKDADTKPARSEIGADKGDSAKAAPESLEERLRNMELLIERQQREIRELRELVERNAAQQLDTQAVRTPVNVAHTVITPVGNQTQVTDKKEAATPDSQKLDDLYKKFGSLRFSGDLRFRFEPFRNQGFDALSSAPDRNRLRIRARLALDGTIDKHFDWGLKLATGIFTDPVTTNQTLTDFFERKPLALERAFLRYDSRSDTIGVQLV